MIRRLSQILAAMWLLIGGTCLGGAIEEVEITPDPPFDGQQVFTVRLRPATTQICDKIVFDCFLRQEFNWELTNQERRVKANEAMFTYRRKDVKLVEDLDYYISFRVPVSMDKLINIYGVTAFRTNAPVSVTRMRISGIVGHDTVWSFETEAKGLHQIGAAEAEPPKAVGKADDPPAR